MITALTSLVISTVSGFLILTATPKFKFKYEKVSYSRLVADSTLLGMLLLILGQFVKIFLVWLLGLCPSLLLLVSGLWHHLLGFANSLILDDEFKFTSANLFSFLFAAIVIIRFKLWEWFAQYSYQDYVIRKRTKEEPNALEDLTLFSFQDMAPIMINLKNTKSYVGVVLDVDPEVSFNKNGFFKMMPLSSGYRDAKTKEFNLTNDYGSIWEDINAKGDTAQKAQLEKILKNCMVFNINEVISGTIWLEEVYSRHQRETKAFSKRQPAAKKKPATKKSKKRS